MTLPGASLLLSRLSGGRPALDPTKRLWVAPGEPVLLFCALPTCEFAPFWCILVS